FSFSLRAPPASIFFPYTTLFRSMLCGTGFIVLHGREWTKLIAEGLTLSMFPAVPGQEAGSEFATVSKGVPQFAARLLPGHSGERSEEHTSELQSRGHLVCRLLLE